MPSQMKVLFNFRLGSSKLAAMGPVIAAPAPKPATARPVMNPLQAYTAPRASCMQDAAAASTQRLGVETLPAGVLLIGYSSLMIPSERVVTILRISIIEDVLRCDAPSL